MSWHLGSRQRLTRRDLHRFSGDSLFDVVARTVCEAECLPRKELYESWAVVRKASRRLKGRPILDLAGGHGLAGWLMLLHDRSAPTATCVDIHIPASAARLGAAMSERWPRLAGRVELREARLEDADIPDGATILAIHACGGLTDAAIGLAIASRAGIAALPCCHSHGKNDAGGLEGWLPTSVAIDTTRAARLRQADYRVWTSTIDDAITPENRLLMALPA